MARRQKAKKKRNRNDTEISGSLSKLPLDIIMDILSRLPAKAVFDCRLVCKSWLTLVRDPHLAEIHLTRPYQNQNPSIIFESFLNLHILDNLEESNVPLKLKFPFMNSESSFLLVGSCNGLVCARDSFDINRFIYIFNPVTGEYFKLPEPTIQLQSKPYGSLYAFCYHPPTNEYKVFRMVRRFFWCEAEIFTLNSNSWRKIKGVDFLPYRLTIVAVNGAIHWFSYLFEMGMGPTESLIASFDVGEEEFRAIEYPAELPSGISCFEMDLGVLGGCLSLCYSYPHDQNIFVVWVMKEHGVKESWTKQFVIKETGILEGNCDYIRPLCILNNGKILLAHCNRLLVSYDPESKMVMYVRIHGFPLLPSLDKYKSITHVGSLVSLRTIIGGVARQR